MLNQLSPTLLLLALVAAAPLGHSTSAAQAVAVNDTLHRDATPAFVEAALVPAPKPAVDVPSRTTGLDVGSRSFEPGLMTTVLALATSAFWLTVVAHVLGRPPPRRRRRP